MKRSVNFTGRKPMKASHVVSIGTWLGMTDNEMRVVLGKAPLFVNIAGCDTVPATIQGVHVHYAIGGRQFTATYNGADIREVEDAGETWYEINDSDLVLT